MARKIALQPRKAPQQARSRQMREDILTAAVRVLQKEGALRFTTPRVAEVAGISVGSLYQYFPNKQALVFAIHTRAMEAGWIAVQRILDDTRCTPRTKLRRIATMFFLEESAEVRWMGAALSETEAWFVDRPEYRALGDTVLRRFTTFVREARPRMRNRDARFAAQLVMVTLERVGKQVAAMELSSGEVRRWANACAQMLSDHLQLDVRPRPTRAPLRSRNAIRAA